MNDEPTRVLIVDDHPMFRQGIRAILQAADDIAVVGEAGDGTKAIDLAAELQPDVVLMDLNMPGIHGIEATREIVRTSPHVGVVVITMTSDDDSVFAAMRAGCRGYLLKGADGREILRAVRSAGSGEAIFGAPIARRIRAYFDTASPTAFPAFPDLTEREREILNLIAAGRSNTEITRRLVLSPKTVRNHITNIFFKLQVADRNQAIVKARQAGLGSS